MEKILAGYRVGAVGVGHSSWLHRSANSTSRTSTTVPCPRCTKGKITNRYGERVCVSCGHDLNWEAEKAQAVNFRKTNSNWAMWD